MPIYTTDIMVLDPQRYPWGYRPALEWFDGFESGSLDEWNVVSAYFEIKTDRVYSGTYSAGASSNDFDNTPEILAEKILPEGLSGQQISKVEFYWLEASDSRGMALYLVDKDNNDVIGVGSDNPQWMVFDNDGVSQVHSGSAYETWHKIEILLDWGLGTCAVKWTRDGGGENVFPDLPMINNTNMAKISIRSFTTGTVQAYFHNWFDNFLVEL